MLIQKLYAIEAELRKKTDGTAEQRREYRQQHSQPVMQQLYEWLNQHQLTVPSSSPTAKAINYTLKRWPALSRYLDDGNLPICNNWVENQMRPWALGRKNWFCRFAAQWSASGKYHDFNPVSKAEWAGSVCLFK